MSKKSKILIVTILIIVLLAVIVYSYKELNKKNEIIEEEFTENVVEDEIVDDPVIEEENVSEPNTTEPVITTENTTKEYETDYQSQKAYESSDTVGTTDKKAEAIDLVKKYWGEDDTVTFRCDSITASGDYIIAVTSKQTAKVSGFFRVNLEKKSVEVEF